MNRIHRMRPLVLSLALLSLACGGENIGFTSDAVQPSTGGQASSGGALVSTGGSNGGASASAGGASSITRAGYAGGMSVVAGTGGGSGADSWRQSELSWCWQSGNAARYYYDTASCTAGSVCSPPCNVDADCPTLDGRATACIECDKSEGGGGDCSPEGRSCARTCVSEEDCPSDMNCLPDGGGYSVCMFADTPWAPGCEGYCARGDEECGDGAPCCDGLTCSPWGTCEDRACVDFAWECGEGLPPCCDPFSCIDGFCQSTP